MRPIVPGDTTSNVDLRAALVLRAMPFEGRLAILREVTEITKKTRAPSVRAKALVRRFVRTQVMRNAIRRLAP